MKKRRRKVIRKTGISRAPKKIHGHSASERVKDQMLKILLRGRGMTLGEACKAAGLSTTVFYYRLKHATFGTRRGKERRFALSAMDARKLGTLIRRQERLQSALQAFESRIKSS